MTNKSASLDGATVRVMNGAGNRISVLDLRDRRFAGYRATPDDARAIAVNPSTSFDQLMTIYPPELDGTDAVIEIHNTDGSSAEACGNGTRCVAWQLDQTEADKPARTLQSPAGLLLTRRAENPLTYTVDMGKPRFAWQDIPLSEPFQDTRFIELHVGPRGNPTLTSPAVVSMGNPHAVFWVDDVSLVALDKIGPVLEFHPLFPQQANISIVQVLDRATVIMRTWERGAGLTLACGSAACAAAVSAARLRRADRKVSVHQPGGTLEIEWADNDHVLMTGPVEHERDVVLTEEMFRGVAA
ncbi:MAG: diaminopimelate epimerase [Pseudomonadota bacterium]